MLQKKKTILIACSIIAVLIVAAIVSTVVYMNNKSENYYTVAFMVDNKVYYQAKTPLNKTTQFPTNPTKEGYAFIGWYNNEDLAITEIKEQTSKKIVLTAKWEIDTESTNFLFDTESGYTITELKDDTSTTICIPDYVTAIGDQAFIFNENMTQVTFAPNSQCKTIGTYAFQSCASLQSIAIPKSMETIAQTAFYMCSSLKNVTFEPNACLTTIGGGAFSDCYALETITIPASVATIGDAAFSGCTSLQNIHFEKDSQLANIASYAFSTCTALKEITLPASVTNLGEGVFMGCSTLEKVFFAKGAKLQSIGDNTFSACKALISVHIPASVTYVGSNFDYSIKEVYYEGAEESAQTIEGLTGFMQSDTIIYYYTETAPTTEGNFWHYVNDKITKW